MKARHLVYLFFAVALSAADTSVSAADIPCEDGRRYYDLAREAGASGDFDRAVEWLEKSTGACNSYSAWHLLGTASQKLRRLEDSLGAYEQAVGLAPSQDQAAVSMARYGQVLALNGQRYEALTMLERAIDAHSSPPSWMRENARELDLSLAQSPISSDSIKRSLASQEFGLLAMNQMENRSGSATTGGARVRIPINYKLDSVEMDELTAGNINALGEALASGEHAGRTFTLVGHTDVRGTWEHNLTLAEQRAEAARAALEAGFPSLAGRLRVVGAGEARPRYPGEDLAESEHRLNRRLEVIVN